MERPRDMTDEEEEAVAAEIDRVLDEMGCGERGEHATRSCVARLER